jgi:hypothetical protein
VLQAPILGDSVLAQWVLVVDESAAIGREKVLTVLATPLLLEERKTALLACDIQVLSVETANSWTGEAVLKVLKKAAARLQGSVVGIISDRCANLLKAVRLSDCRHIHDCTHWMASCLEKFYAKDSNFLSLMACLGTVRQKWTNSQFCGLLPPKMRTTSRFLNLFEIVGWSKNMLDKWNSLAVELKEDLLFLDLHRVLIEELALFCNLIKSIRLTIFV